MPTPPAPAWISAVSPACETPELEEAVVGRAEGNRHAGRRVRRHAVGDLPGEALGRGPALGVRPVEPDGDGPVPHCETTHRRPDLDDRPRALVTHDVRHPGQVPAQPVQRVTALDADRLDVDQDVSRSHDGIGHVLVTEDVGCSCLVIDGGLHTCSYSSSVNSLVRSAYQREVWGSWVTMCPLASLK